MNVHITKLVEKHFGAFVHGGLLQAVNGVIQAQLQEHSRTGMAKLESLFQVESLPFTQNEDYFFSCKDKFLTRYKSIHRLSKGEGSLSARLQDPLPELPRPSRVAEHHGLRPVEREIDPFDQHVTAALRSLAALGFGSLKRSEVLRLLPSDEADPALDIMAEVRAYWQVAYRRFADLVPLEIDHGYVRAFDSTIHFELINGLGLTRDGARENCTKWLEEDPAVVSKREELTARKRMLEAARASLACIAPAHS